MDNVIIYDTLDVVFDGSEEEGRGGGGGGARG